MTPEAAFLMAIGIFVALTAIERFAYRYASWHPVARATAQFARTVNVPRRRGEPLAQWARRVEAAHVELSAATDEFLAAVRRGEGSVRQISPRGYVASLPPEHPAAVRYALAKGELPLAWNPKSRQWN